MSSQKILILDNNEIILTKSMKAKSVYISIRPFERVKVTVPFFISFKKAEDFVIKKKAWIQRNLLKLKSSVKCLLIPIDSISLKHILADGIESLKYSGASINDSILFNRE